MAEKIPGYDPSTENENSELDWLLDHDSDDDAGIVGGDLPPPLQPTGATSTTYKPPGADSEAIELSNMDYNESDDSKPLLKTFMSESDRETAVERVKRFISDKF